MLRRPQRHASFFWLVFLLFACYEGEGAWRNYNPKADPRAIVEIGNARFTILTSQLVRMEWSPTGTFEDRASITFMNRFLPVVNYTVKTSNSVTTIKTAHLLIRYDQKIANGYFTNESLVVIIDDNKFQWYPGMSTSGNLLGTVRTLDGVDGSIELNCSRQPKWTLFCTEGLVSRSGWVLVDDSWRPLLNGDKEWDWVIPRNSSSVDWYLFGHGHNYRQALADFTKVALDIPLPPRYTFGIFWSRYWAYSDLELKELVNEYVTNDVPLDVIVIDMDWHITFYKEAYAGKKDPAGQPPGWTGYTWDRHLFPNPMGFLSWLLFRNLRVTMNLHPASGVQPFEERYPQMATAMGINPATRQWIPFDITNKTFAMNLMDIMLKPLEEEGVTFWWLDWQQWETTAIPDLNPTIWLNYVFTTNNARRQSKIRPIILHRWGGLGNHKFAWGFSGDVIPSWSSLQFQPYFTWTAANVGYMWSHDLGGHTGPTPPELYTRWIQWGTFSPVFRPHSTKRADIERRIWMYPWPYSEIMKEAFHLRSRLVPYLYTQARHTHDSGVTFLYPLYYDYPESEEAYMSSLNEYKFGPNIIVAPVVQPVDTTTGLAAVKVWIPPGVWVEWFGGAVFTGPQMITRYYALNEIPVFVRAGTIIPMLPLDKPLLGSARQQYHSLHLKVFVGGMTSGFGEVYEDKGDDIGYLSNEFAWTNFTYRAQYNSTKAKTRFTLQIMPTQGSYPSQPTQRSYRSVEVVGVWPPDKVTVNGIKVRWSPDRPHPKTLGWRYEGSTLSVVVTLPDPYPINKMISIILEMNGHISDPILTSGFARCFSRLAAVKAMCDTYFPQVFQEDYQFLLNTTEIAQIIGNVPSLAVNKLKSFKNNLNLSIAEVNALNLPLSLKSSALAYLTTC